MSRQPRFGYPQLIFFFFCTLSYTSAALGQSYSVTDIRPTTVSEENHLYYPTKINQSGQITGANFQLNGPGYQVARIWTGSFEEPVGGTNSRGYDLTSGGLVTGSGNHPSGGVRAYLYNSVAKSLFWLPCPVFSQYGAFCEPYGLNSNGIVVGTSDPRFLYPESPEANSRALKWNAGAVSEMFPGSGVISAAYDVNASGTIVGMYNYRPFIQSGTSGPDFLFGSPSVQQMVSQKQLTMADRWWEPTQ